MTSNHLARSGDENPHATRLGEEIRSCCRSSNCNRAPRALRPRPPQTVSPRSGILRKSSYCPLRPHWPARRDPRGAVSYCPAIRRISSSIGSGGCRCANGPSWGMQARAACANSAASPLRYALCRKRAKLISRLIRRNSHRGISASREDVAVSQKSTTCCNPGKSSARR